MASLPMTLRVYQKLSSALSPLAPALIKRRLKLGKEDPARIGERRGMSRDIRPAGPLVWIHGASVGEVLAAAALIEKLRALKIRILLTSGTAALVSSVVISLIALFGLGVGVSFLTRRPWLRSGLRQLSLGGLAALVTYLVGQAIGANVG